MQNAAECKKLERKKNWGQGVKEKSSRAKAT